MRGWTIVQVSESHDTSPTLEVRLYEERIGRLVRQSATILSFEYDDDYTRRAEPAPPLSTCLPLAGQPFHHARVTNWFEGLLPEGARREFLARVVGTSSHIPWDLLNAAGAECAGAVQTVGPEHHDAPHWITLSETDLARILESTPVEPLASMSRKARISIAGVQDKIVVYLTDQGDWALPLAGAPSTYIFKPQPDTFPELVENEHFCMSLARAAGLDAAVTSIMPIAFKPVLIISRYDRRTTPENLIERVHQEDFAQALGRRQKYQSDGGPTLREIGAIPGANPRALFDRVVFSWLIGNCDAHAKNYSILEPGTPDARLAPAYDLVCTECYPGLDDTLAIRIGKATRPQEVQAHHLRRAGADLTIDPEEAIERAKALAERTGEAIAKVRNDGVEPGPIDTSLIERRAEWTALGLDPARKPKTAKRRRARRRPER